MGALKFWGRQKIEGGNGRESNGKVAGNCREPEDRS